MRRAFDAGFVRNEGFQRNYENSLLRTMMREAHELILLYCEETDQFATYKAEPWFQFARVMRNIISHKEGGTLRKWPDDLQKKEHHIRQLAIQNARRHNAWSSGGFLSARRVGVDEGSD